MAYASYTADPDAVSEGAGLEVRLVLVEFQIQGQFPAGRLRPYAGVGIGGAADFRDDRLIEDLLVSTVSASGGVAVDLGRGFSLRAEVRGRGLDELEHSAVEYGLGLSVGF